jgi:3-hydroxyisobutyrate dehydrogenase
MTGRLSRLVGLCDYFSADFRIDGDGRATFFEFEICPGVDVPSIFAGHYDPSFPIALCLKDLRLIEELIADTGARHELTTATHDRFKEARARYGDAAGEMTVCRLIEDDAGVSLRVAGDWTPPWEEKHPNE